jgi:hypothetical protein
MVFEHFDRVMCRSYADRDTNSDSDCNSVKYAAANADEHTYGDANKHADGYTD